MRKFQKENPNFSKNFHIFFNLIKIIRKKIYDKEIYSLPFRNDHGSLPFPFSWKIFNENKFKFPSHRKKKEREKKKEKRAFLLNFYLCFWPLGSLYALLHFLSSSPSSLCPHAANVYLRGCWLHHGMQTGRLIKPPSTYIPSLLSPPLLTQCFLAKPFAPGFLLYDHLCVYSSWFLAVPSLGNIVRVESFFRLS